MFEIGDRVPLPQVLRSLTPVPHPRQFRACQDVITSLFYSGGQHGRLTPSASSPRSSSLCDTAAELEEAVTDPCCGGVVGLPLSPPSWGETHGFSLLRRMLGK